MAESPTAELQNARPAADTIGVMAKKRSSPLVRIFVRIGALRRFHALSQKTADLPVEVSWDRRRQDREAAAPDARERGADRRQKPPYTWEVADFVVVEDESTASEAKPRAKKR
jgi:hypothetical protein